MDDRGVSAAVSYAIILAIVALLMSTLFVGFAPFVMNQQQDAVQSTLVVFGHDLAGDIDSADRLATRVSENGTVELRSQLPTRVGGTPYEITIDQIAGTRYEITLRSTEPDAFASVQVRTRHPLRVESQRLDGGSLRISYDANENELVIADA